MAGEQNAVAGDRQFELQAGLKLRQGEGRGWLTIEQDTIYERDVSKEYNVVQVLLKGSYFLSLSLLFFYLEEIGLIQEGGIVEELFGQRGIFCATFCRYYIMQLIVEIISELYGNGFTLHVNICPH